MDAIEAAQVFTGFSESGRAPSNAWSNGTRHYFSEIGRENRDGAITGTVFEYSADGAKCWRAGSFRIEPCGELTRWAGATKAMREAARNELRILAAFANGAMFVQV